MPLSYLHVFNFSERPGTPAEKIPEKYLQDKGKQKQKADKPF